MSGSNIAINRQTGEIQVLSAQGEWAPAQRARNPQSGAELFYDGAAWKPVPAPPPPPSSVGRSLGLGVRDAAQGLMAVPGMMYDGAGALVNTATGALEAVGGPSLPRVRTATDNINSAADAVGLPTPATPQERVTSMVGQGGAAVLPMIATGAGLAAAPAALSPLARMLSSAPATQVLAGASGGMAQQGAAEAGAGPIMQGVANVAGGLAGAGAMDAGRAGGRLAASLIEPLSDGGRQRIAAEALLRSSSRPDTLAARLQEGLTDQGRRLPGAVPTAGTAARDPSLLRVESSVRAGALGPQAGADLTDSDFARNALRNQFLDRMSDGQTAGARGANVRTALEGAEVGQGARVNQAFEIARDRNTSRYSVQPVLEEAGRVTRMFDPAQGGGGVPAELQDVLNDMGRLQSVGLSQAQNIRSRLGEIAGRASMAGDNRLASAAGAISQRLEDTIDDPRWMSAVAERRGMGQSLGRNEEGVNVAGSILRNDRFGSPTMPDARVAAVSISDPAVVRQVLGAGYKAIDDARTARLPFEQIEEIRTQVVAARNSMRGQFIDELLSRSQTTATTTNTGGATQRQLSAAQFQRAWDQRQAVAQELFEPGQYRQLERLAADFREGSMAANTGATRGSQTAQNLSVGNLIARVTNGLVDADNPLARQLGGLGGAIKILYSAPEQATRDILVRAMAEPEFAQVLLSRATPQAMERAMGYIERDMGQRFMRQNSDRAGQQGVRTTAAPESQPPQQPRAMPAPAR